jgi:hypothetical protein
MFCDLILPSVISWTVEPAMQISEPFRKHSEISLAFTNFTEKLRGPAAPAPPHWRIRWI